MAIYRQTADQHQSINQSIKKHYKKSKFGGACANEVIDDFAFAGIDSSPDMAFISVPNDAWLADSACTSHISTVMVLIVC